MTNKKIDDSVIDAEDIIGLGLLKNHTHFLMGEIDDENIEKAIRAAFLIFAAGDKGERYVAKNTSIMCHQFTDSMDDKYHNIKAAMKETEHLNKRMVDILTEATGLVPSKVKAKLLPPSDVYLTAEELLEYGVADHIL